MANIGHELALITAGTEEHHNACTVMYGAIGMIWSKDVYIAFVKPERYTWEFVNDSEYFTISYFPKNMNGIHKVFGYQSGREKDKEKATGITPEILEHGIGYLEANEIYVCRKLYMKQMDRSIEPLEVIAKYNDPNDIIHGECHYAVIGEIVEHIIRE